MLKELIGYFNNIKKTQAEMKFTLSEIKKNLQGIKSVVDEAENQINDLEHKEEKNIQSEQQEKRIKKIMRKAKEPLGQLQMYQHRGARKRRERATN